MEWKRNEDDKNQRRTIQGNWNDNDNDRCGGGGDIGDEPAVLQK